MIQTIQILQSLAQAGLAYTKDVFDRERFTRIQKIAAELLSVHGGLTPVQAEKIIFDEEGYRTPKVDVRGAVLRNGEILLVQEKSDGLWCLPGGWADINETPAAAVEREVLEETGLKVRAERIAAIHDTQKHGPRQYYHSYKLIFLCEYLEGTLQPTAETTAGAFFSRDRLPALSERRTTAEQIALVFSQSENPALPTEFD